MLETPAPLSTTYPEDLLLEPADRYARLRDAKLLLTEAIDRSADSPELRSRLVLVRDLLEQELTTMLHSEPALDPASPPTHSVLR